MRRFAVPVTLVLLLAACSGDTSTSLATPTTDEPTTTSTSTTIPATTTTTLPIQVSGLEAAPELVALIEELYDGLETAPDSAEGAVGVYNAESSVAVVEAGDDVTFAVADPNWRIVGGWWPSIGMDPDLGEFPKMVAVIGGDARPGGDPNGSRADSIHFLGVSAEGDVSVVGLPRDTWVDPPGRSSTKMTNTLRFGGPELFVETASGLTGLEFDGYVLTGFQGFTDLIQVLGGLDIDVPLTLADRAAKAYIDAGRQILSPRDALAFARTRKTISGGDFKRQEHGGLVLIAAADMVRDMGPTTLPFLFERTQDYYFTDYSAEDMLLTVGAIISADIDNAVNVVAPGRSGTSSGGASIVRLTDDAPALFEDLADGKIAPPVEED